VESPCFLQSVRELQGVVRTLSGVNDTDFAPGDVVRMSGGVGNGSSAIVTAVSASYCTVTVLDAARSEGLAQLWPSFNQLQVESRSWRVGAPVVISGLKHRKLQHLNGARGVVGRHPREGHPVFVAAKNGKEGEPQNKCQLRLVVVLDELAKGGEPNPPSVLVEARCVMSPEFVCESLH